MEKKEDETKMFVMVDKKETQGFTYQDFSFLSKNENGRYAENSELVAHALIRRDAEGHQIALQYDLPEGRDAYTPNICSITDIEAIERNGMIRYRAKGPDGQLFYAKRLEHAQIKLNGEDEIVAELAYFSEDDEEKNGETMWGSSSHVSRFLSESSNSSRLNISNITKGGHDLTVDPAFVRARDENHVRMISQNKIMGKPHQKRSDKGLSARDAYENFFNEMKNKLSPDMLILLQRAFSANIKTSPENQYRPEWLHAYGFSLTPISDDPQHKGNLGAAGKWANTEMMILERMAKWFALNQNASTSIKIKTIFDMLEQSELIDTIYFEINLEFEKKMIKFFQNLDVFQEKPVFRKASDLAQATGVSYAILHGAMPVRTMMVTDATLSNSIWRSSKVYKRVPESIEPRSSSHAEKQYMAIMDTETTGLNSATDKIIELGVLLFSFTEADGILELIDAYNGLQDPGAPLDPKITEITHITDEQLKDQTIDWNKVSNILQKSNCVICHNSGFDRKMLEAQTPANIQAMIRTLPFGCTMMDINWRTRGMRVRNLKDLNKKLGFEFDGHRATHDCWAALNLLREAEGALAELLMNMNISKSIVYATGKTYAKRDYLKANDFQWSADLKVWFTHVHDDKADDTKLELEKLGCGGVIRRGITAMERYSVRADITASDLTKNHTLFNQKRPCENMDDPCEHTPVQKAARL